MSNWNWYGIFHLLSTQGRRRTRKGNDVINDGSFHGNGTNSWQRHQFCADSICVLKFLLSFWHLRLTFKNLLTTDIDFFNLTLIIYFHCDRINVSFRSTDLLYLVNFYFTQHIVDNMRSCYWKVKSEIRKIGIKQIFIQPNEMRNIALYVITWCMWISRSLLKKLDTIFGKHKYFIVRILD